MANKAYEQALSYVQVRYPDLYLYAVEIHLIPVGRMMYNTLGTCSDRRIIRIANKRQCASLFVDTLVHELTHAEQVVTGRLRAPADAYMREREAVSAGYKAISLYRKEFEQST